MFYFAFSYVSPPDEECSVSHKVVSCSEQTTWEKSERSDQTGSKPDNNSDDTD